MRRLLSFIAALFTTACFAVTVCAYSSGNGCYTKNIGGYIAALHDLDDTLTENEEKDIIEKLGKAVEIVKFNVCVLISDNIGSNKSDRYAVDYADVYYEDLCGIDTDGILLLINNDTKYDIISTSGKCITLFTDYRIDAIFDSIYDDIVDGDYSKAISKYISDVQYYSGLGEPSDVYIDFRSDNIFEEYGEFIFFAVLMAVVFEITIISNIVRSYNIKPQKGARGYLLKNSLHLDESKDTFIRVYVTHHSSSSGSRSGGHRSSSHRSSGGGHHGGGGRHR